MSAGGQAALYAVVGHPVGHSLSPRIHKSFAEETGQALEYSAIELPLDGFSEGIGKLRRQGYAGVNVTVPFKREAWELCDSLSQRAADAGAVNTLCFDDAAGITGDNTDGVGLVRDLDRNLGVEINGRDILVLGAGGAVRGVLGPLLAQRPKSLTLANRTPEKARRLARDFSLHGNIETSSLEALGATRFDLVVNGTAAGLDNEVPPIAPGVIDAGSLCYDMMYRLDAPTAFVAWARGHGAGRAHDGLGMLVEQAAEAFRIWRGVVPDTAAVIRALRPA